METGPSVVSGRDHGREDIGVNGLGPGKLFRKNHFLPREELLKNKNLLEQSNRDQRIMKFEEDITQSGVRLAPIAARRISEGRSVRSCCNLLFNLHSSRYSF